MEQCSRKSINFNIYQLLWNEIIFYAELPEDKYDTPLD